MVEKNTINIAIYIDDYSKLKSLKIHPRESFADVLRRVLKNVK